MWLRTIGVTVLVLAGGCDSSDPKRSERPPPTSTTTSPPQAGALDVDALVVALERAGATLLREGTESGTPFDVEQEILCVDEQPLHVYEYSDPKARVGASSTISADGSQAGNAIVEWVGPPHFFAQGRIIVLYLGTDDALQQQLSAILGPTLSPEATSARGLSDECPSAR